MVYLGCNNESFVWARASKTQFLSKITVSLAVDLSFNEGMVLGPRLEAFLHASDKNYEAQKMIAKAGVTSGPGQF